MPTVTCGLKFLPLAFGTKRRDVVDCRLVDARLFGRRNERRSGPNFRRERDDRVDQTLLQLEQIVSRLNDNARKANVLPGNEVYLKAFNFQSAAFDLARIAPAAP